MHEIGRDDEGLRFFVMKKNPSCARASHSSASCARSPRSASPSSSRNIRGIVPRDPKPDNILIGDYGDVYVLDWGDDAVSGLQVLTAFVVGHTVATYAPRRPDEDSYAAYDGLAAEQFPRVREAARHLLTHDLEEEFEFGLDAMFAGLEARLAPRRSKQR